jgi:hypothetical protein
MDNFYARSVFFVKDGEAALTFYTESELASLESEMAERKPKPITSR